MGIDDMPIAVWWKYEKTRNVALLLKEPKKVNRAEEEILTGKWSNVFKEYISEFGFSDTYRQIMQLQIDISKAMVKKMTTGDNSYQTFINIYTAEMKELEEKMNKEGGNESPFVMMAWMTQHMQTPIDENNTSVKKYMYTLKYLNERQSAA